MIYSDIVQIIGNTPIIKIDLRNSSWELYIKLEKFNPGQSMKDRMALNMINQAEKDGILKPGGTVIESSSGNTATGLAMICAARGYKFIAVVDHHASKEKIDIIRAYGGEILYVKGNFGKDEVAVVERERTAEKLSKEIPNSFFPHQAHNISNRKAYPYTLGKEIINDVPDLDVLIASIGTGGSLCGTSEGIKEYNPNVKVIAIEPKGSIIFGGEGGPYFQSGTGNPPGANIPSIIDFNLIDENDYANDKEAFNTCRFFAKNRGILIGGSSGGVLFKAIEKAINLKGKGKMVAILCDGGEKYISSIFNDKWMSDNNLIDANIKGFLGEVLL